MSSSLVWKEAKSQRERPDNELDDENNQSADAEELNKSASHTMSGSEDESTADYDESSGGSKFQESHSRAANHVGQSLSNKKQTKQTDFKHYQIDLKFRRNITALADPAQHKPKIEYVTGAQSFDSWIESALVSISPSADVILFSSQSPTKMVFLAKLRIDPIHQYGTKTLEIPLDYNEQITSLLCLPIMSTQRTSLGLVDWTALVVGLSSGYIKFYTEQSVCLISLKFCDEPVIGLKLQTQKSNSNLRSQSHFASIVDELFIAYQSCAVVADGFGLYENLRISKEEAARNHSGYEPAYNSTNLPTILTCQRWKFDTQRETKILDADLLGMRCTTRFDALRSDSMNSDHIPSKSFTRTLALVGKNPFMSCYREARDTTTHSYTEMIGSLLPFWRTPQPSRVQINDINCSSSSNFFDKSRLATSIVPSPDRRLAAVTDDFGRVSLVDATNWLIVRLWKGYRNAQCGWVEVKRSSDEQNAPCASFLVIYAPRRGLLEVWSVQRGPRVAAFNVGKSCRLLYAGYKMLNMRAECSQKGKSMNMLIDQSYATNCYLLNAKSETVFSIELPYTYSLYKYGDLQSRDRLLINELLGSIQNDAEVNLISETLHRISLAESLEQAIQKICSLLLPERIIPIMENLINKIMKNYDNHSGETMTDDDQAIVELCKRIIRLCSIFNELSQSNLSGMSLPDVNNRLIEQYEEHPQEIDEFAQHLGWTSTEVLRYLSLLALESSYRHDRIQNPWPDLGEPLTWSEFIECFDLKRLNLRSRSKKSQSNIGSPDKISIKLKEFNNQFITQEKIVKTAHFLYNRPSESFYKVASNSPKMTVDFDESLGGAFHKCMEPSTRLVLLFQFWLSTNLCNHWRMWAFLQRQIGQISDEIKVIVMTQESDELLIESWKRIYHLILESDNIYAATIATAATRSDTLRMISDNEKRDKLEREESKEGEDASREDDDKDNQGASSVDWECLCVDAERMSLLSQQLEDVFLLRLLLKYAPNEGRLVDNYVYRVPKISVASILRSGPTIVSELIAQWAAQANIDPRIFTQPYGLPQDENAGLVIISEPSSATSDRYQLFQVKPVGANNNEHAKELLHHTKTSFPRSLDSDVLLLNCIWEYCNRWISSVAASDKAQYLNKALDCIALLTTSANINLKHNSACMAYKTFFQRTFERLAELVETNSTILSPKCFRSRDTLSRRELNMSEDCLEDFVQFCHKLSDLMLETCRDVSDAVELDEDELKLKERLLLTDDWWSTVAAIEMLSKPKVNDTDQDGMLATEMRNMFSMDGYQHTGVNIDAYQNPLVRAALLSSKLFDINTLIELNRLTTLMLIIFGLRLIKAYPLSLIGEDSRQVLKLDLQQSPTTGADMKIRSGLLNDLRNKFARKCIVNIVTKLTEENNVFGEDDQVSERDLELVQTAGNQETAPMTDYVDPDSQETNPNSEKNESMVLFTHLLTLATEWHSDCDELHLELVFELFRCNHDKLAAQVSNRIQDKQTLADGLLKIASQRILVLFGLSPQISSQKQWRDRVDKWSNFQPNVSSWLKGIQDEECKHELANLVFPESVKPTRTIKTGKRRDKRSDGDDEDDVEAKTEDDFDMYIEQALGLRLSVMQVLRHRTKTILEVATNYLDGQANRLAYDLLQLLESQLFWKFLKQEKSRWSELVTCSSTGCSSTRAEDS